ncbi:MAG: citramalate synthase [Acidimicrobiales bacterium]
MPEVRRARVGPGAAGGPPAGGPPAGHAPGPRIEVYDTTLRDGSQQEGLSLSVEDKLRVAAQLDHLGVHYIEGGWPGANPKDDEFFARARGELSLARSVLVAFASTRRPGERAETDKTLLGLVGAGTSAVCIVAKASELHVREALRTDLGEALAMVRDSVRFLCAAGLRVFLDAEHFFDGYAANPDFALDVLQAAEEAGAEALVLCDTNGGTLPDAAAEITAEVCSRVSAVVGAHFHNDGGLAVANSLAAVRAGARQVQGCVNGYGERTGNADLTAVIANLTLKMGRETIPADRLELLTPVAHHVAELVNRPLDPHQPFVGPSAFAHKAGLHTSAMARHSGAYEHLAPGLVGNGTRVVVSELAGRSTVAMKAAELGLDLDAESTTMVLDTLKRLEYAGYHFEAADASLELLLREAAGYKQQFFRLESFRVIVSQDGGDPSIALRAKRESSVASELLTEATVKVWVADERIVSTAEGTGPVHALDAALRAAIGPHYDVLSRIHLVDFKVRVLGGDKGTGAVTRVLVDTTNGERTWSTIGVSDNVIEASWQALSGSLVYGLMIDAEAHR